MIIRLLQILILKILTKFWTLLAPSMKKYHLQKKEPISIAENVNLNFKSFCLYLVAVSYDYQFNYNESSVNEDIP